MTQGEIPQSQALAEASPESLSELFARDPEGYSKQDLARIVATLRDHRERMAKAEGDKPVRQPKVVGAKQVVTLQAKANASDLDL